MAVVRTAGERLIAAPPDRVYRYLADYREHHPRVLRKLFADELERLDRYAREHASA